MGQPHMLRLRSSTWWTLSSHPGADHPASSGSPATAGGSVLHGHCLLYRDLREPAVTVMHAAFDDVKKLLVQSACHRTGLAVSNCDLVDSANRCDLSRRPCEEDFIGDVEHLAGNHLLHNWES